MLPNRVDLSRFAEPGDRVASVGFGQVAQLVERGPEKAGVGGSIPSLATNTFKQPSDSQNIQISSREQYATFVYATFALSHVRLTYLEPAQSFPWAKTVS